MAVNNAHWVIKFFQFAKRGSLAYGPGFTRCRFYFEKNGKKGVNKVMGQSKKTRSELQVFIGGVSEIRTSFY